MENHIATSQDFKTAFELDQRVERVMLPKLGKPVLMRRPPPLWFVFRGQLPHTLAIAGAISKADAVPVVHTPEEAQALAGWIVDLLSEVMVQPRISLSPGPDEIPPDLLADEDLNFIIRWAVGEVACEGSNGSPVRDLAPFRED
ncbi:MAG TPA: hypothetical protein VGY31_07740 [Terriglobia bacterium]|nr:hypothetical protein [Terriglobia bacterium]